MGLIKRKRSRSKIEFLILGSTAEGLRIFRIPFLFVNSRTDPLPFAGSEPSPESSNVILNLIQDQDLTISEFRFWFLGFKALHSSAIVILLLMIGCYSFHVNIFYNIPIQSKGRFSNLEDMGWIFLVHPDNTPWDDPKGAQTVKSLM